MTWRALHGAAWLGGIGFTMSLFIAGLAFGDSPLLDAAKIAVLGASTIAGPVSYTHLVFLATASGPHTFPITGSVLRCT